MSNVSVTNEIIAARRLFPSRYLISMGVRKSSVSSIYAALVPGRVSRRTAVMCDRRSVEPRRIDDDAVGG